MNSPRSRFLAVAVLAALTATLSSCATATGRPGGTAPDAPALHGLGSLWPAPPAGDVVAEGTVMEIAGDVELCLGPIAESYPPQCSGIPLEGWSWEGQDIGVETSGDVTWGAFAVRGTFDGETFTALNPGIPLALYDPIAREDPTGGRPGKGTEAELLEIQEQLPRLLGDEYFASYPDKGWLWVDVLWDDGTWQKAADEEFGAGKVVFRSALRAFG